MALDCLCSRLLKGAKLGVLAVVSMHRILLSAAHHLSLLGFGSILDTRQTWRRLLIAVVVLAERNVCHIVYFLDRPLRLEVLVRLQDIVDTQLMLVSPAHLVRAPLILKTLPILGVILTQLRTRLLPRKHAHLRLHVLSFFLPHL